MPQETREVRLSTVKSIIINAVTSLSSLIGTDDARDALFTSFQNIYRNDCCKVEQTRVNGLAQLL